MNKWQLNKSSKRADFRNKLLKNRKEYQKTKTIFFHFLEDPKKKLIFPKKYPDESTLEEFFPLEKVASEGNNYLKRTYKYFCL